MIKKILLFGLLIAVAGAAIGYYMWNKPHMNMTSAKAQLKVQAKTLFADFEADENAANARYVGKVLAVKGTVKESTIDDGVAKVILETEGMFGVACALDPLSDHVRTSFEPGEKVTMKGTCTGYNLDVQLDRCVEVK